MMFLLVCILTMAANQAWVSAEVRQGGAAVLAPTILEATDCDTFGSLLEKLGSDLERETVEKVTIAGAGPTVHVVPMNAPVAVVSHSYEML